MVYLIATKEIEKIISKYTGGDAGQYIESKSKPAETQGRKVKGLSRKCGTVSDCLSLKQKQTGGSAIQKIFKKEV